MKVGMRVTWESSGTKKEGVITHIVPGDHVPADIGVLGLDNSGIPRRHESYVVRGQHVRNSKPVGSKANYWPRVSLLTFHDDGKPSLAACIMALKTIAEFPITHPDENMDAFNMQKIASDALGATP